MTTPTRASETSSTPPHDVAAAKKADRRRRIQFWAMVALTATTLLLVVSRYGAAVVGEAAGLVWSSALELLTGNAFWALAAVPGAFALYYYFFIASRTFSRRHKSVAEYLAFRHEYDLARDRKGIADDADPSLWERHLAEYVLGAVALTLPFLLVAWLAPRASAAIAPPASTPGALAMLAPSARPPPLASGAPADTPADTPGGNAEQPAPEQPADAPRPAAAAEPAVPGSGPGSSAAQPVAGAGARAPSTPAALALRDALRAARDAAVRSSRGVLGLVLAGYGAFFYVLLRLVFRVNEAALSPKFLVASTLRVSVALVLGFLAGFAGLFGDATGTPQQILYVMVGAFPSYAGAALQRKARELLRPTVPGTEPLPLELIDGIDEFVAELLGELGVSDVQHLSTMDPGELTMRTLYPLDRCIDWIDQAILITYLRANVVSARELGIRGAIDMRGKYRRLLEERREVAFGPRNGAARKPAAAPAAEATGAAAAALRDLAAKCSWPEHVIHTIGENLVHDYHVEFLADLWHRRGRGREGAPAAIVDAVREAIARTLDSATGRGGDTYRDHIAAEATNGLSKDVKFERELRQAVDAGLDLVHLAWRGHLTELSGRTTPDEIEEGILRSVGTR